MNRLKKYNRLEEDMVDIKACLNRIEEERNLDRKQLLPEKEKIVRYETTNMDGPMTIEIRKDLNIIYMRMTDANSEEIKRIWRNRDEIRASVKETNEKFSIIDKLKATLNENSKKLEERLKADAKEQKKLKIRLRQ